MSFVNTISKYAQRVGNAIKSFSHSGLFVAHFIGGHIAGLFKRKSDNTLVDEGYVSNSDTYSIINRISENVGKVNIHLVKSQEDPEIITEGFTARSLVIPTTKDTKHSYLFKCTVNLLNTGDLFIWPIVRVNQVISWQVLPSVGVTEETNQKNELINWVFNNGSGIKKFKPEEIIHIPYFDPSLFGLTTEKGLSPLQSGYMTLSSSNDIQIADASIIKNRGASGFVTSDSEAAVDPESKEKLQADLTARAGGAINMNKAIVTTGKLRWIQMSMSPSDLKILENDLLKLRKLCNLFSADSSLFNDPANKTFNNRKEAMKALFNDAVIPTTMRIIQAMNKFLIENQIDGLIIMDVSHIEVLQEDKQKEAQKNKIVSVGIVAVLTALSKGEVSKEAARILLIDVWKVPEDRADEMVNTSSAQVTLIEQ